VGVKNTERGGWGLRRLGVEMGSGWIGLLG